DGGTTLAIAAGSADFMGNNKVVVSSGGDFVDEKIPLSGNEWAVWGSSPDDIWVGGYNQWYVHRTPSGWSLLDTQQIYCGARALPGAGPYVYFTGPCTNGSANIGRIIDGGVYDPYFPNTGVAQGNAAWAFDAGEVWYGLSDGTLYVESGGNRG